MKIKYVGLKDSETAFSGDTGITWTPGSEHDIKDDLAARMLKHPDVFEAVALVESKEPAPTVPPAPDVPPVPGLSDAAPAKLQMQTEAGALDLSVLTKEDLHALAKESGLSVHPNAKAETVAAKLAEAFPVKAE